MAPKVILILRHAESPKDSGDPNLPPEGYQHAFALARFIPAEFGKPDLLFATRKSRTSNRPVETLTPASQVTGVSIDSTLQDQNYEGLAERFVVGSEVHEHVRRGLLAS